MVSSLENLLILGGNSKSNSIWVEEVRREMGKDFRSSYVQVYEHWKKGSDNIDLDVEAEALRGIREEFKSGVVFAKSAGSLLTCKASSMGIITPKACIFVGLPYPWGISEGWPLNEWFKSVEAPVLLLQHTNDPTFHYIETDKLIKDMGLSWQVKELPGDTHDYREWEVLRSSIEEFLVSIT